LRKSWYLRIVKNEFENKWGLNIFDLNSYLGKKCEIPLAIMKNTGNGTAYNIEIAVTKVKDNVSTGKKIRSVDFSDNTTYKEPQIFASLNQHTNLVWGIDFNDCNNLFSSNELKCTLGIQIKYTTSYNTNDYIFQLYLIDFKHENNLVFASPNGVIYASKQFSKLKTSKEVDYIIFS
jgi:hypothetical protein